MSFCFREQCLGVLKGLFAAWIPVLLHVNHWVPCCSLWLLIVAIMMWLYLQDSHRDHSVYVEPETHHILWSSKIILLKHVLLFLINATDMRKWDGLSSNCLPQPMGTSRCSILKPSHIMFKDWKLLSERNDFANLEYSKYLFKGSQWDVYIYTVYKYATFLSCPVLFINHVAGVQAWWPVSPCIISASLQSW